MLWKTDPSRCCWAASQRVSAALPLEGKLKPAEQDNYTTSADVQMCTSSIEDLNHFFQTVTYILVFCSMKHVSICRGLSWEAEGNQVKPWLLKKVGRCASTVPLSKVPSPPIGPCDELFQECTLSSWWNLHLTDNRRVPSIHLLRSWRLFRCFDDIHPKPALTKARSASP